MLHASLERETSSLPWRNSGCFLLLFLPLSTTLGVRLLLQEVSGARRDDTPAKLQALSNMDQQQLLSFATDTEKKLDELLQVQYTPCMKPHASLKRKYKRQPDLGWSAIVIMPLTSRAPA